MTIQVGGTECFTNTEAAKQSGVTRQTLRKWRAAGVIPLGRQYRGRTIVFTLQKVELIAKYAHRIEPLDRGDDQLSLFDAREKGASR